MAVRASWTQAARALLRGHFGAVLVDLNLGDGGRGEEVLGLGLGLARSTLRNKMASYRLRSAAFKPPRT